MPRYNNTASTRTALQELAQRQQQQIEARTRANEVQTAVALDAAVGDDELRITLRSRPRPWDIYSGATSADTQLFVNELRNINSRTTTLVQRFDAYMETARSLAAHESLREAIQMVEHDQAMRVAHDDILDPMLVIPDGQMLGRGTRAVYFDTPTTNRFRERYDAIMSVPADRPAHNFEEQYPLLDMVHPRRPSPAHMSMHVNEYASCLRWGASDRGIEACEWHAREQDRYVLHPYILKVLDRHLPNGYRKLVEEWPHASLSDPTKVAYTRSPEHGVADRQTVTSLGKYLRMHFAMPDHEIRDLCALAGSEHIEVTHDMERMLEVLAKGPHSCMRADADEWPDNIHPYNVYAPELGWGMAYRSEGKGDGENIMARALVYEGTLNGYDHVIKGFVRSYKKDLNGGYSHSDEAVETYLRENGYKKMDCWPDGVKLKHIPCSGGVIMPYIDGGTQTVTVCDCNTLAISEDGEICGDNTCGYSSIRPQTCCECCENYVDDEDINNVGEDGDESVCDRCLNNEYTWVRGNHGDWYYVRDCDAVATREGDNYHDKYLSENEVVELEDGEYTTQRYAVLATNDEWYHEDDEDVEWVRLAVEYEGCDVAPIGDAWQCERSGNWYHDDDDENELYFIGGCTVHKDELTAQERIDEGLDEAEEDEDDDFDGTNDIPMTVEEAESRQQPAA